MKQLLPIIFCLLVQVGFTQTQYTLNGKLGVNDTPEKDLDVQGDARVSGNFTIGDSLIANGYSRFSSTVQISAPDINSSSYHMAVIDENGSIRKVTSDEHLQYLYEIGCNQINTELPYWQNGPGISWIGDPCPQNVKVGIGTSNPLENLHVRGSGIFTKDLSIGTGTTGGKLVLNNNGQSTALSISSESSLNEAIRITNNNGAGMLLRSNGDVAFGTEIVDNSKVTILREDKYGIRIKSVSDVSDGAALRLETNGSDGLLLSGVNTSDLEVFRVHGSGLIEATEIQIKLTPFPDYVFDSDYELMPLDKLREYIATNRKLPQFPSQEEVEEKGVQLGELQRLQQEKIEELVLYIFQLEERILELESKK